ncbi:MAG: hypothetical protein ACQEQ6_05505 [Pseudomonadota bacterium]
MTNYFTPSQVFVETYSDFGVSWPVLLYTHEGEKEATLYGRGTHFMIPRQGQVEMKWVFDALSFKGSEKATVSLRPSVIVGRVCYDDYDRWIVLFEKVILQDWLKAWMEETSDHLRANIARSLVDHDVVRSSVGALEDVVLSRQANYVEINKDVDVGAK